MKWQHANAKFVIGQSNIFLMLELNDCKTIEDSINISVSSYKTYNAKIFILFLISLSHLIKAEFCPRVRITNKPPAVRFSPFHKKLLLCRKIIGFIDIICLKMTNKV